jgi:hypothetical protein
MDPKVYAARKAAGQCPACPGIPKPGYVYCAACLARFASYRRPPRTKPHPVLPRLIPVRAVPTIGCCGQEHPVTHVPFRTTCCGRVFGALETP